MRPCRPACRSGRLDNALPRPSICSARLAALRSPLSGRRPAGECLPVLAVGFFDCSSAYVPHRCRIGLHTVAHRLRGLPRFNCMAEGHPLLRPARSDGAKGAKRPEGRRCLPRKAAAFSTLFTTSACLTTRYIFKGKKNLKAKNYRGQHQRRPK